MGTEEAEEEEEVVVHTAAMCAPGLSLDCEAILCECTGLQWRCGISCSVRYSITCTTASLILHE